VLPVEEPYRINQRIRVPELRVLVDDGENEEENLGVMPTGEALKLAQERDLDLVEIAPQAQPPVAKIMDYGRFKYQTERKQREAHRAGKAGRAASEMKDVQLSPRIDEHDMAFKVDRAYNFLTEGHPVRMVVRFLGRDMRHPEVGRRALDQALEILGAKLPITADHSPRMEGRQMVALVRLAKGAKPAEKPGDKAPRDAAGGAPAAGEQVAAKGETLVPATNGAATVSPDGADGAAPVSAPVAEPVPVAT
jgi:translation initiation factor IF-3